MQVKGMYHMQRSNYYVGRNTQVSRRFSGITFIIVPHFERKPNNSKVIKGSDFKNHLTEYLIKYFNPYRKKNKAKIKQIKANKIKRSVVDRIIDIIFP